jgi:cell shape-determining protein MreD
MSWVTTALIFAAAFLAVFWEAAFNGLRHFLGAQVDLLPALMVYAALRASLTTVCLLAVFGGLCFDSLSANPLGITVLPQFAIGFPIFLLRDLILRDQVFAQWTLGLVASAVAPLLTLMLLLTIGHSPVLGWGTLWQIIVMTAGGAIATPICFVAFEWLNRALVHLPISQPSFRPDREIRRGR